MTFQEVVKAVDQELGRPEATHRLPLLVRRAINSLWRDVFGDWLLDSISITLAEATTSYEDEKLSSLLKTKEVFFSDGSQPPTLVPLRLYNSLKANTVCYEVCYVALDVPGQRVLVWGEPSAEQVGVSLVIEGEFKNEEKLLQEAWELVQLKALSFVPDDRNPVWIRDFERLLRDKRAEWSGRRATGYVRNYKRRWF